MFGWYICNSKSISKRIRIQSIFSVQSNNLRGHWQDVFATSAAATMESIAFSVSHNVYGIRTRTRWYRSGKRISSFFITIKILHILQWIPSKHFLYSEQKMHFLHYIFSFQNFKDILICICTILMEMFVGIVELLLHYYTTFCLHIAYV